VSKKEELTFAEFQKMCEDAGIQSNPEEMEQDFRVGAVIADLVDDLMDAMEGAPPFEGPEAGFKAMDVAVDELNAIMYGSDLAAQKRAAIKVASIAVRYAADVCHDDEGNN
jgi:hypothetical protein